MSVGGEVSLRSPCPETRHPVSRSAPPSEPARPPHAPRPAAPGAGSAPLAANCYLMAVVGGVDSESAAESFSPATAGPAGPSVPPAEDTGSLLSPATASPGLRPPAPLTPLAATLARSRAVSLLSSQRAAGPSAAPSSCSCPAPRAPVVPPRGHAGGALLRPRPGPPGGVPGVCAPCAPRRPQASLLSPFLRPCPRLRSRPVTRVGVDSPPRAPASPPNFSDTPRAPALREPLHLPLLPPRTLVPGSPGRPPALRQPCPLPPPRVTSLPPPPLPGPRLRLASLSQRPAKPTPAGDTVLSVPKPPAVSEAERGCRRVSRYPGKQENEQLRTLTPATEGGSPHENLCLLGRDVARGLVHGRPAGFVPGSECPDGHLPRGPVLAGTAPPCACHRGVTGRGSFLRELHLCPGHSQVRSRYQKAQLCAARSSLFPTWKSRVLFTFLKNFTFSPRLH